MVFFNDAQLHKEHLPTGKYSLNELQKLGEVKELIEDLYMLIRITDAHVEFAFFSFVEEGKHGVLLEVVMYGDGYTDSLRECRHTYWGDSGYIFYPNAKHFTAIFKELAVYFDDMETV